MKKAILWLAPALALALLGWAGCSKSSEAKITVTNRSAMEIKVAVNSLSTTLAAGAADTVTMTWPGRDSLDVTLMYYPINQPNLARYRYLELYHGDTLSVNLGFED
jgi:hypothetical protein